MPDNLLLIYCAGGLGREVLELSRQIGAWTNAAFIDDGCNGRIVNGVPVYSFDEINKIAAGAECSAAVASGEPEIAKKLWKRLEKAGIPPATLVHPSVYVPASCQIEPGVIIQDRVFLGPDCELRRGCYINCNSALGHDVKVGAYSNISMGCMVAGHVTIGSMSYIGAGTVIRDEVTIGGGCIIGMGSLVTKNIPDNVIAYGAPCRIVEENTGRPVFQ